VATVVLVLLSPLLLVVSVAIVLDSRGPVLFRQSRLGSVRRRDGIWEPRTFRIFKFRSMTVGADEGVHAEHVRAYVNGGLDTAGAGFKLARDARVTRVGRLLRRTSLDEVPQLLNVLRGEMSLVGPRPVPVYEAVLYDSRSARRLAALPGLTGLWQVRGRSRRTHDEMMELDLEYVEQRSLLLDLHILLATVPAVVRGDGAS
jgi:lipopolysaccharide/colanic/teichoic acid biosynthesis glycosyltransferase